MYIEVWFLHLVYTITHNCLPYFPSILMILPANKGAQPCSDCAMATCDIWNCILFELLYVYVAGINDVAH